ncbi:hypothetical protein [Vibrio sp. Isolate24]|uniref:chorismate--pyruvate lyase family protein n=1 Tax=Vibrio sp. Isolate24 TaxID=2908534 RepID=UPI001EFEB79C|nr:hypothetical protein [Vibrio sp. Isolate24]MCG9676807.1 hypothetical protein [Vibrio sp. Isolate24]
MNFRVIDSTGVPQAMKDLGSLTQVLRSASEDFQIQLIRMVRQSSVYTREVILCDGALPLVWAKSTLFSKHEKTVAAYSGLEGQSLGEQLLFSYHSVSRSPYQFIECSLPTIGHSEQCDRIQSQGRISRFTWQEHDSTLVLIEVFYHQALKMINTTQLLED